MMKATVDKNTCVGCGLCIEICPEVFTLEDDGKAIAISESVPDAAGDACKQAADECPVQAIFVNL